MNSGVFSKDLIAVVVAHPDDETLWAGGSILRGDFRSCTVLSLCRGSDPDRAPRFFHALKELGATGQMADLDDGPDQFPLDECLIIEAIKENLPPCHYDRIYTHSPQGEYSRHLRHEETGRAVLKMWLSGEIRAKQIFLFAYEDGGRSYLPRAIDCASVRVKLPEPVWWKKYRIVTEIYNFSTDSFEARTTPETEAFWSIETRKEAGKWLNKGSFK